MNILDLGTINTPYLMDEDETKLMEEIEKIIEKRGFIKTVEDVSSLNDAEFAQSRMNGFGGSDSSVLLDVAYSSKKVDPKTIDELIEEKITETWDKSIQHLASVRKGRELEPLILKKLHDIFNATILKPNFSYMDYKTGLAMNFDGIVYEKNKVLDDEYNPVPIEIKVATTFGRFNYVFANAISEFDDNCSYFLHNKRPSLMPNSGEKIEELIEKRANTIGFKGYYYTQLQQEIYFLGATHGYLAVLDELNWEIHIFKVPRDEQVISILKERARKAYEILAHAKGLRIDEE